MDTHNAAPRQIEIAENLRRVRASVAAAAAATGKTLEDIQIIAVSKTFPIEAISGAIAAGQVRFGENRVQEAQPKILSLRSLHRLEWHLVGHLQSNKARKACELFDVIHSVDSLHLAERINQACLETGRRISVLIQVDLAQEETKFGADPARVPEIVKAAAEFEGIRLDGLMTLPPLFENPEQTRPYFVRLRKLLESLESRSPGCLGRRQLSMGMSHDFETAIHEGATMVRIGTSIFGARIHANP